MPNYVVRGLTESGKEVFYTGRSGQAWVSDDIRQAFAYSLDGARYKAKLFNGNVALHGIWFVGMGRDQF